MYLRKKQLFQNFESIICRTHQDPLNIKFIRNLERTVYSLIQLYRNKDLSHHIYIYIQLYSLCQLVILHCLLNIASMQLIDSRIKGLSQCIIEVLWHHKYLILINQFNTFKGLSQLRKKLYSNQIFLLFSYLRLHSFLSFYVTEPRLYHNALIKYLLRQLHFFFIAFTSLRLSFYSIRMQALSFVELTNNLNQL